MPPRPPREQLPVVIQVSRMVLQAYYTISRTAGGHPFYFTPNSSRPAVPRVTPDEGVIHLISPRPIC